MVREIQVATKQHRAGREHRRRRRRRRKKKKKEEGIEAATENGYRDRSRRKAEWMRKTIERSVKLLAADCKKAWFHPEWEDPCSSGAAGYMR